MESHVAARPGIPPTRGEYESAGRLRGHVLVIDDEPPNRLLLHDLLTSRGHRVTTASGGEEGLTLARDAKPDVILLDVMMPQLDGFEVCRRLKEDPTTAATPVLLVTSLDAREDRLRGMRAGANDFLTKPVDSVDLLLRVRNAITTKQLFDQLHDQFRRLRELEGTRDTLVHMVIHDLRSPLTGLQAYLDLLRLTVGDAADPDVLEYISAANAVSGRLKTLVAAVLDVSRLEAGQMPLEPGAVDLKALLSEAVASLGPPPAGVRLTYETPRDAVRGWCDQEITARVIANLVGNAFKFTPEGGEIRLTLTTEEPWVRIAVTDTGSGIPEAQQSRIFEKFGQASGARSSRQHSVGLGLTFAKLAVEAQGGAIGLRSAVDRGSTFWFTLPRTGKATPAA